MPKPKPPATLRIYRASSGQWSGILVSNGEELGRISGCANPQEVEQAVRDEGFALEHVEVEVPEFPADPLL